MTDYKKYLNGVKPEEFIEALNSRTKECKNSISRNEEKLLDLKKQRLNAKTLTEMDSLETQIYLTERSISTDKQMLYLIDDVLQKLGWSVGYKRKWKTLKK